MKRVPEGATALQSRECRVGSRLARLKDVAVAAKSEVLLALPGY
jgi:hypothetical protein